MTGAAASGNENPDSSWKTWPAWVMLGLGLLVTVISGLQIRQNIDQDALRQFAFACDQVTLEIRERLGAHALILRGAAGLFAASKAVDRQQWSAYVETLRAEQSVPGAQGIGFAQVIAPGQLAAHVSRVRGEGFPQYEVRPAGVRELYTSIVYLEPFRDRNLRAFGFDMHSEPVRRAAMERARDSGEAALSGKVVLVQETGSDVQAGTLMYVPVYRNGMPRDSVAQRRAALFGWTYSPYRMNDLMAGILGQWERDEGRAVVLQIYDGLQATAATLMFSNKAAEADGTQSLFRRQRMLSINGQQWLLVFDRTRAAAGGGYADLWSALLGGLAISGLLFGLMRSVINTRANAARIATGLTEKMRNREESFQAAAQYARSLLEASLDPLVTISAAGKIIDVNVATEQATGLDREQLIGSDFADYFTDPAKAHEGYLRVFSQGSVTDYPLAIRHVSGRITEVLYNASLYRDAGGKVQGVFAAARDITQRKLAEDALRRSNADLQRFAEVTAHHLQEPARRIATYAARLREQLGDLRDDSEARLSLEFIGQQAHRQQQLLLDVERYLASAHPRGEVGLADANRALAAILARSQQRISAAGAQITLGHLPPARIDMPRLDEVFSVALDNALAHGCGGQSLRIIIEGERQADKVRYSVSDNGPGIEEQYRDRVFRIFERLSSSQAATGIGLAILRRVTESCGGRAWLEEAPGGGCRLLFELPAVDIGEPH